MPSNDAIITLIASDEVKVVKPKTPRVPKPKVEKVIKPIKEKKTVATMTKQEKIDWDELYQYFKIDIMEYSDKKLPQYVVLRLRGLTDGKFMSNKNSSSQASYTFREILMTLKLSKSAIEKYFMNNNGSFADEKHRINGVFVIVESEINNTKDMLNRCKIAKEKCEMMDVSHLSSESAEYKSTNKGINSKLKELL